MAKSPNHLKFLLSIERILEMLRYTNFCTTAISVDLRNSYHIISVATWNKEEQCYFVSLYIKEKNIDLFELIEKHENVRFDEKDPKSIRSAMAENITKLYSEGFFDYYINRYDFEMKCFDKGIEFWEAENV